MNIELAKSLIYNISLLLALSLIYAMLPPRLLNFKGKTNVLLGFVIGGVGIAIMINPFELIPGIVFDVRTILIGLTGIFFGFVPTIIATTITALFRLYQGGMGAIIGVCILIFTASVGITWRHFRLEKLMKNKKTRSLELFIFGFIITGGGILFFFLLPLDTALTIIKAIIVPSLLLYSIGTLLFGLILLKQLDNTNYYKLLEESEQRLKVTLLSVGDAVITTDNLGYITLINPVAETITGWTNETAKNKHVDECLVLLNEYTKKRIENPVQKVLETGYRYY